METLLRTADPTSASEPRFDAEGEQARAILAAALVRDAAVPGRRLRLRRLMPAVAVVAVALAGAVVVLPGGVSPREALAAAAQRTAAFESGLIVITGRDQAQGYELLAEQRVRFSGDDIEMQARSSERLRNGEELAGRSSYIVVDGVEFHRDDDAGTGWKRLGRVPELDLSYAEKVLREVDNRALVAAVEAADDVVREGDRYRATLPVRDLAALPVPAFGLGGANDGDARLELQVDANGLIRRLTIRAQGRSTTIEYLELGTPQPITPPR